jgi:hypothetical protein
MKITPSLVLDLKKYLLQFGSIILVMVVLSMTITQVQANGTIRQQIPTGNRSGLIGSVVIDNIHADTGVEISCQVGSIYGIGGTTLVQRNFGPSLSFGDERRAWQQYWCPFTGAFPGVGYYWVILYAAISEPGGQSYTLVDTSPPVWIG